VWGWLFAIIAAYIFLQVVIYLAMLPPLCGHPAVAVAAAG